MTINYNNHIVVNDTDSTNNIDSDYIETFNPFSINNLDSTCNEQKIHLRVQQRSTKKNITILEGLPLEHKKKIVHDLKIKLGCSGTEKNGELHFSGDQRKKIADYLVAYDIVENRNDIIIHGF
jgi:translation initiation factor SUI1